MVLVARAGDLEQSLVRERRRAGQHRLGDGDGVGGEAADQPRRRLGDVGHALGELGADRLLHLAGKLGQHVVEQGELGGLAAVDTDEKEVGHFTQQLAAAVAGGLLSERDQVVKLGVRHHG